MRNRDFVRALLSIGLFAGAPACQGPQPAPEATSSPAPAGQAGALAVTGPAALPQHAAIAGSVATSVDERGVPRFLVAAEARPAFPGATAEGAARYHVEQHAQGLGLGRAALDAMEVRAVHRFEDGTTIARLGQRVGGVEVYGRELRVLMNPDLGLAALAGSLDPIGEAPKVERAFRLSADDGLAAALADIRAGLGGGAVRLAVPDKLVKRVLVPSGERLLPAYVVECYAGAADSTESEAWHHVIAADDGRVLERRSLTAWDAFTFRVWADMAGDFRPTDGPQADYTPHPTGKPDGTDPAFTSPILVKVDGLNHNLFGTFDSWLPPMSTQTVGNNVDAYTDRNAPDGLSNGDFRATATAAGVFDRTYDVNADPTVSNDQAMAGVTQLFFDVNWLHDYWYDSGFDEKAGNAQRDNYGRGGAGNDVLRAEAQDSSGRNNANMSTPSDGLSPRMQMYIWTGPGQSKLTLAPGGDVASGLAGYGPINFNVTAPIVLVNDGSGTVTDACQPIQNNVMGKIALVDRGTCSFKTKTVNAQAAGAVGVILADNNAANMSPPGLGDDATIMTAVTIPTMSIRQPDGVALKAALMNGAVSATLFRKVSPDRDATLDNTIVAHEWGHYLHHRLADCGLTQCRGMSEGWGDFVSLHTLLRPGDDLDGTYGVAIYASRAGGDSGYYGLRRQPFTTDMTKNGLTFKHIATGATLGNWPRLPAAPDNAEVHNAGELWASVMWDAYVALHKAGKSQMLTFEAVRRKMADYVVRGLQLTPSQATWTEQRDAILAAIYAKSKDDMMTVATAFARRGLGTCAVSPADRDSKDNAGIVESFDLKPRIAIGAVTLDDAVRSCDGDGVLDDEERGNVVIQVRNAGPMPLVGTKLALSTAAMGVSFKPGAMIDVPDIAPYATVTVTAEVALDRGDAKMDRLDLKIDVTNAGACEATVSRTVSWRINYDEAKNAAATDDVEAPHPAWTPKGSTSLVWAREQIVPLDYAWRGIDYGSLSDTSLESPELQVSANASFVVTFDHRYTFEAATENMVRVYYDGAVIELSDDGGGTWKDAATYVMPPYNGTLTDVSGNPLAKRKTFADSNPSWPKRDNVSLDFGKQLAGKKVKLRFRIGSDQASGAYGWEIDNLAFTGIDNKPFPALVDDMSVCGPEVVADAGPDQMVKGGAAVLLDAAKSRSRTGKPLTFSWKQTAGTPVTLARTDAASTAFAAPIIYTPDKLTFEVTVSDGTASAKDTVDVMVAASDRPPDMTYLPDLTVPPDLTVLPDLQPAPDMQMGTLNGGGCEVGGSGKGAGGGFALASALALVALVARGRRRS